MQTLACHVWAALRFIKRAARGFHDQLQDVMALTSAARPRADALLRAAARSSLKGTCNIGGIRHR
jgi:cellobiose phosphorylase